MAEGLIQDETSNVTSKGGSKILGVNSQGNLPMQIRILVLVDPV